MIKPLLLFYLLALLLFLYSYGFVDFNLTLSAHPAVTGLVAWSRSLAMFNRPSSLYAYLAIVILFYLFYFITLLLNYRHQNPQFPWKSIIFVASVLAFAYPFLSADVFKYLFAAKELLLYHANPHTVAPQVFADDTWLRFMRWIHTPSPYGPVMTGLAIPPYLLGLGKFVPTLYLYKLMSLGWYLLSIWLVGRLSSRRPVLAQLFFALNPLILTEWLVNAHNDAPMITLLLLTLYLHKQGRVGWSLLSLLLSIGIKYVTVLALPITFLSKKFAPIYIQYSLFFVLLLAPLLYHYSTQYQPWYVTWLVPLAALSGSRVMMSLTAAYSLGALLRYTPFIQTGLWHARPLYFAFLTFAPLLVTALYFLLLRFFTYYHDSNYGSKPL